MADIIDHTEHFQHSHSRAHQQCPAARRSGPNHSTAHQQCPAARRSGPTQSQYSAPAMSCSTSQWPHTVTVQRTSNVLQHVAVAPQSPRSVTSHIMHTDIRSVTLFLLSHPEKSNYNRNRLPRFLVSSTDTKTFQSLNICFVINPLNTKRRLLYLNTQFLPRSKHFSSRL